MFTKQIQDDEGKILEIGKLINIPHGPMIKRIKIFIISKSINVGFKYPKFKLQVFKFIDTLPSLNINKIFPYFKIYVLEEDTELPKFWRLFFISFVKIFFLDRLVSILILFLVKKIAKIFVYAETPSLIKVNETSIRPPTYDILGEVALSPFEAKHFQNIYLDLIQILPPCPKFIDPKWRTNISIKCSGIESRLFPEAPDRSVEDLKSALRPILRLAMENGIGINLDMEQYDIKEIISRTAMELFMEAEFKSYPHFGIVVQAYLKSAKDDLRIWREFSISRGTPITIRLVKGAYLEYERIKAEERGWLDPVFKTKSATDINFEDCVLYLLDSYPYIRSAFGTHNLRSLAFILYHFKKREIFDFEIQMLYGMAEKFKTSLESMSVTVREYSPIGSLLPGMAYLIRRLLENTSNQGFLYQMNLGKNLNLLIQNPRKEIKNGI